MTSVGDAGGREDVWLLSLRANNRPLTVKVDTGASCNCISERECMRLGGPSLLKSRLRLMTYSGHSLSVLGEVELAVEFDSSYHLLRFVVVKEAAATLLGLPTCKQLGLVNPSQQSQTISSLNTRPRQSGLAEQKADSSKALSADHTLAVKYSDVFEGIGMIPGEYKIQLRSDATPRIQSPRRVPFRLHQKFKDTLAQLENDNIITKVTEPTAFCSPLVTVVKPSGALRLCLDPKALNDAIKREHYMLPTPSEIFAKLSHSRFFTTLDATSGFLQVRLDTDSSYLTTFATSFGRYRWLRLPFGSASAPEVFHRLVHDMFSDMQGVESYIDDI